MNPTRTRGSAGFTLLEVMIAAAIFSIGIMGFLNSFTYIARAVQVTRGRTVASNLTQAQVEALKNNSYYALQVTTVTTTNTNFSPSLVYSAGAYGPNSVSVAGITFTMAARVDYAAVVNGVVTTMNFGDPDPGMKQITVYVMWKEQNKWKYMTLSNLLENPNVAPQTATLTGTVKESGSLAVLSGVTVKAIENPSLQGLTNASGVYSFKVNAGTYTLQCSSSNFYLQVSTSMTIAAGTTMTKDFTLNRIATGTVTGLVWKRPTLPYLITQVVTATTTYVPELGSQQQVEFVELTNPTTSPYSMAYFVLYNYRYDQTDSPQLKYRYTYGYPWIPDPTWDYMSYRSTYIPANSSFLIANTSMSFVLFNSTVTPDAWYESMWDYDGSAWNQVFGPFNDMFKRSEDTARAQTAYLYSYDPNWITFSYDYVGWPDQSGRAPYMYKTDYPRCKGVQEGEQLIRFSSPAWTSSQFARVYDTENNRKDFDCDRYSSGDVRVMTHPPYRIDTGTQTAIAGVPAVGALVSVNDLFSNSTAAYSVTVTTASGGVQYTAARYTLQGVSTGTWTVNISSGALYTEISTVTVSYSGHTVTLPSTPSAPGAVSFHNTSGQYAWPDPVTSFDSDAYGSALASVTYYYRISSIDATGIEDMGGAEWAIPANGPTGAVRLTWPNVSGAVSYRIYRGTYSGGQSVYLATGSAASPGFNTDLGQNVGAWQWVAGTPRREAAVGHSVLTATGTWGYVSGFVTDVSGLAIPGIQVVAAGIPKTTNSQGFWYTAVTTGSVTVLFNPGNANSAYVSETMSATVEEGVVISTFNVTLLRGGTLKGYVTSGVTALPNVAVNAVRNNTIMGTGTSDSSGYFYIYNLSTGSYTVTPALDPIADASPDNATSSVTQGVTTFTTTFTVTGAYGTLTGTIKKAGASVTTGALIIASSVTVPASPPTVTALNSAASDVYYSVSSLSDGTYTLLVRGATNFNYNLRAFYPRITGDSITTDTINYSGVSVSPGGSTTQNIEIP